MKNPLWAKAIKSCADPQRAKHFLDLLAQTSVGTRLEKCSSEQVSVLVALLSGSQALSNLLVANPDWLDSLDVERIRHPRRAQGFRADVEVFLKPLIAARDFAAAYAALRKFKQREMLRIAARDLARLSNAPEITQEISDVADVCLDSVWKICREQFTVRFGQPYHQDAEGNWQPTQFCVLGLGKLGGQELNYSSDVDVIFLYSDEGQVFKAPPSGKKQPPAVMSSHQFFCRIGEALIAEVSRATADGFLFRIDLRLRPEGDAGPLARSLEGYENYYAQWGQTWERMMLIKARGVAGDSELAAEFLETIQTFRYPRSTGGGVLREVAATKDRIETEIVGEEELDRNVKLGRGGIREIEFTVQMLQLLHAGRQPFLQSPQTLPCLAKLAQYKLLEYEDSRQLADAYCFLRDVEHRLQMDENLQTHTIPSECSAQERLAKLMGFASRDEFEAARKSHTQNVRRVYDGLLKADVPKEKALFPATFEGAEDEWKSLLAKHRFRDEGKAFAMLKEFVEGPGYVNVSPRTMQLARQLLPKLFALCPQPDESKPSSAAAKKTPSPPSDGGEGRGEEARFPESPLSLTLSPLVPRGEREVSRQPPIADRQKPILSDPDRVVTRLDSFIGVYGARSTLFELWNSNPAVFELLLLLFDRSEFLAEMAIRTPDLVDDLVSSGRLRQIKTAREILDDLRHGLADEDQFGWLRRYHEAEFMRIGLRDILGLADFEQNFVELSALADACLQYALESVMRRNKIRKPPFVIIGLGKLGGCEINYGSDLDMVFVTDAKAKELPKLQKLAAEVMELMSRRTEHGIVFVTDARLRPDGEKGLLVNTIAAYEEYYRGRAQLWEIQSLTRTRPVTGDMKLGSRFQEMAAALTDFKSFASVAAEVTRLKSSRNKLATKSEPPYVGCYVKNWKEKIHEMRMRIEKERTPAGQDELAIKTGKGGLMDAEFVAQTLCLENGWHEANTLHALERGRDAAGVQPSDCGGAASTLKRELQPGRSPVARADWDELIENYRQLRRLESILRRWSYEGETVLPDDPAPYYRVSVRCGFETPEAFRVALAGWRKAIREVYLKMFGSSQ